jgi:hypothetical protein
MQSIGQRFYAALFAYVVILLLVWTTMSAQLVRVKGREVDIRWIPTLIVGLFAVRSWIHRQRQAAQEEATQEEARQGMAGRE